MTTAHCLKPRPSRLAIQLWLHTRHEPSTDTIIGAFHRWIRDGVVPGILIDVADYSHIRGRPGVMLIAHEGHYVLDRTVGQFSLEFQAKRDLQGDVTDRVRQAVRSLAAAAAALEQESSLDGAFRVDTRTLTFRVMDRLEAPDTPEALEVWEPAVRAAFANLSGGAPSVTRIITRSRVLTLVATFAAAPAVSELLGHPAPAGPTS